MVTSQVEDSISFRNTFVQCQVPRLVEYTQFNLVFAAGRHRLPQHFVSADWVLGDTSAQLEVWASTSHMCANLLRNTLTKLYKLNLVPKATDPSEVGPARSTCTCEMLYNTIITGPELICSFYDNNIYTSASDLNTYTLWHRIIK
jgi:hypothetical protein